MAVKGSGSTEEYCAETNPSPWSIKPLSQHHMPTNFDISLSDYSKNGKFRFRFPEVLQAEVSFQGMHSDAVLGSDGNPVQQEFQDGTTGFDPTYKNIIDYIVRITHRIWETDAYTGTMFPSKGRDVEYISDTYAENCRVHDDFGPQLGSKKIVADTHATTGAFPNVIQDAEEIIWAGMNSVGFRTSHRVRMQGTHIFPDETSGGKFGPATGKKISVLVIANCVAQDNRIVLEHVMYNAAALMEQLGKDVWAEAEHLALKDPPYGWPRSEEDWIELKMVSGLSPSQQILPKIFSEHEQTSVGRQEPAFLDDSAQADSDTAVAKGASALIPEIPYFDPDLFSRRAHGAIWHGDIKSPTGAVLLNVHEYYQQDFPFEASFNRRGSGASEYLNYVRDIRAAIPDLALVTDEIYWMGNVADGFLISTRWSAKGTYSGAKWKGQPASLTSCCEGIPPSQVSGFLSPDQHQDMAEKITSQDCDARGTPLKLWGITQWRVEQGKIVAEWQLFNEMDVIMQIISGKIRSIATSV